MSAAATVGVVVVVIRSFDKSLHARAHSLLTAFFYYIYSLPLAAHYSHVR